MENVLEKILEEIKGLIEKHKNKAYELVAREPLTQCYTEADIEQIKVHELAVVRDIIRKHMDDVPKCGECSRKKLYQIGYEDGKKDKDWISVEDRLPEDDDMRFYMCIVENHEEDLPMFCQYDSEYGFGFWHDIYDSTSLGFVDTVFKTNDELGYEKVVAWQPLPEPMRKE